jgi:hypothetical protein
VIESRVHLQPAQPVNAGSRKFNSATGSAIHPRRGAGGLALQPEELLSFPYRDGC